MPGRCAQARGLIPTPTLAGRGHALLDPDAAASGQVLSLSLEELASADHFWRWAPPAHERCVLDRLVSWGQIGEAVYYALGALSLHVSSD